MAVERRCGPWRETWLGRVRRCNNPLLADGDALEIERTEPRPHLPAETTPALPERTTPPAIERVVMTERRNNIARKLIESVFNKGA